MNQKTLYEKIQKASDIIHKTTLKGPANFMIVSSRIAEMLSKLDLKEQRKKKLEALRIKNKLQEMNVITLCGSTKYKNEFLLINKWLTLQGNIVISVSMFGHLDNEPLTRQEKIILDEVHKRKIDLANEIFVIDKDGYIGESTKQEIEYAKSNGKKIRFLSEEKSDFDKWNNDFYNRQILENWNEKSL